jgi:hypothetical protein
VSLELLPALFELAPELADALRADPEPPRRILGPLAAGQDVEELSVPSPQGGTPPREVEAEGRLLGHRAPRVVGQRVGQLIGQWVALPLPVAVGQPRDGQSVADLGDRREHVLAGGEVDTVDERSDVFGLGAVLAVVLTGRPPYAGTDVDAIRLMAIRGQLAECLARLDGCGANPGLVALCKRCLALDPALAFLQAIVPRYCALDLACEVRTYTWAYRSFTTVGWVMPP